MGPRDLDKLEVDVVTIQAMMCPKRNAFNVFFFFPAYFTIQGLWLNIVKDQLFRLLGPNGAGKTTTIDCLTGITPVSGGDGNKSFVWPTQKCLQNTLITLKSVHYCWY